MSSDLQIMPQFFLTFYFLQSSSIKLHTNTQNKRRTVPTQHCTSGSNLSRYAKFNIVYHSHNSSGNVPHYPYNIK